MAETGAGDEAIAAYSVVRRLRGLKGLTPYEVICETRASEPHRFTAKSLHQMPELNS